MSASVLIRDAMQSLVPPPSMTTADWFRKRFYTADGKAFDEYAVPWVTAPNGPCEAIDNPRYRRIWLQWAARMFKTTFGQGVQMKYAEVDPCPMMFATVDEGLCKTVFGRYWMMFANSPKLRHQVPHEKKRSKTHIRLSDCQVYGAWARGKSRLADKSIRIGHGNEIDKWEHLQTSTEGDPLPRFLKRGAEFVDSKFVLESTPSERNRSRVEAGRLRSTNCKYWVPCPHCARFQEIVKGNGYEPPGIFWETPAGGRSDPDLALKTAHYVCGHCKGRIDDIHRAEMMFNGVWVPEGCSVDHDKAMEARNMEPGDHSWLRGEPVRDAEDYGSQISVFYAVFHGWGRIAADFIVAQKRQQTLRQWTNEDASETWEITKRKQTWEQLGERIIHGPGPGVVPEGTSLLTIGLDKQEDRYVYWVDSWQVGRRSHTIEYGEVETLEEVEAILLKQFFMADKRTPFRIKCGLFDSGFKPAGVHEFCRKMRAKGVLLLPCKGSNTALNAAYIRATNGPNTANPGAKYIRVDTITTQDAIETQLHVLSADEPGGMSIYHASLAEHQDCLEQLLNDAPVSTINAKGYAQEAWNKVDPAIPNDYRDCKRYSNVAMLIATRGKDTAGKNPVDERKKQVRRPSPSRTKFLERPGGWMQEIPK